MCIRDRPWSIQGVLCTHLGAVYFKHLQIEVISKRRKKKKIDICFSLEDRQAHRTSGAVIKLEVSVVIWRVKRLKGQRRRWCPGERKIAFLQDMFSVLWPQEIVEKQLKCSLALWLWCKTENTIKIWICVNKCIYTDKCMSMHIFICLKGVWMEMKLLRCCSPNINRVKRRCWALQAQEEFATAALWGDVLVWFLSSWTALTILKLWPLRKCMKRSFCKAGKWKVKMVRGQIEVGSSQKTESWIV